jgi:hypothetical protein
MSKHKYIYWRPDLEKNEKGEVYANVHILVGCIKGSLTELKKIANEIRQTFPQATDDNIITGEVSSSKFVKGFVVVAWNSYIPKKNYLGWRHVQHGNTEYDW